MLRKLFGEPPRQAEGKLQKAMQPMERFASILHERIAESGEREYRLRKYEIWTLGLIVSLDELEQSEYAARQYAGRVKSSSIETMSAEELLDYHRHIYFDKNAFIRLFALLDKLGTLMNELMELRTERLKPHFSYFTVLRNMRGHKRLARLSSALDELKLKYEEPMGRLRKRRNTEIHFMNSEMQDDLEQSRLAGGKLPRLENLKERMNDLAQGMDMVYGSLQHTFEYVCGEMRKRR